MILSHFFTRFALCCCVLLTACAAPRPQPAAYDFGALPATAPLTLPGVWKIAEVSAPPALDTPYLFYRLSYAERLQAKPYAESRWSMTPAQLLSQRVRAQLAAAGVKIATEGVQTDLSLRLELEEFVQDFSSPQASTARLRWRASIVQGRQLLAQRVFSHEVAAGAQAQDGARALAQTADLAIAALQSWLQQHAPAQR
ncbi:ABC-type transport auxiliary lipoprotein family protein [Massilia sp. W12]|uniref:ABC-type transport auxiliary lipoprotein family protein n=1 Tax=Massilia sp. W12 TaxID=3126507 RepID=UPI0030D23854